MKSSIQIRKQYKAVLAKRDELLSEGKGQPLPERHELYFRLYSIQMVLEWVYPSLIRTEGKGSELSAELAGHKHVVFGPLHATLFP